MSEDALLVLTSVSYEVDERPLVRDVSFRLGRGEFMALLGPNGAGKTTLLRLIGRILEPSGGRIELEGRDVAHISRRALARTVATVPQETLVTFPFTVDEFVLMGRNPHLGAFRQETRRDLEVAQWAMELAGVTGLGRRTVNSLSGGERQRVVIARALAQQPMLLLLDEPTSALDLHHQVELFEVLARLNESQGLTILVVSHDVNLAARYSRRIAFLHQGAMAADGPVQEVFNRDTLSRVFGVSIAMGHVDSLGLPFALAVPPPHSPR